MSPRLASLLVLVFALLFAGTAFAEDPPPAEPEEPKVETGSFPERDAPPVDTGSPETGTFQSEWGDVNIVIEGSKVSGSWKNGTFSGTIDENKVIFYDWEQSDGTTGKGTFVWNGKGRWVGSWGFGASTNNGGDWTLYK